VVGGGRKKKIGYGDDEWSGNDGGGFCGHYQKERGWLVLVIREVELYSHE